MLVEGACLYQCTNVGTVQVGGKREEAERREQHDMLPLLSSNRDRPVISQLKGASIARSRMSLSTRVEPVMLVAL